MARPGSAWHDKARQGLAGQGKAGQGINIKEGEKVFESKITKMGRRRIINVPEKKCDWQPGTKVKVVKKNVQK